MWECILNLGKLIVGRHKSMFVCMSYAGRYNTCLLGLEVGDMT